MCDLYMTHPYAPSICWRCVTKPIRRLDAVSQDAWDSSTCCERPFCYKLDSHAPRTRNG